MGRLSGKVVVVTGAASGIGRAMALGVGAEGGTVVVADRDVAGGEATVRELNMAGGIGQFVRVDVATPTQAGPLVAHTVGEYGRLDGMVCNAGVAHRVPSLEVTEAEWDAVVNVNLRGTFFYAQAAARQMASQGSGAIVFTSSQLADFPRRRMAHYIASKSALLGLTRCLALEWGPLGIRVNAIQPGVIQTAINRERLQETAERDDDLARTAIGRLGRPADLIGATVFLLSEDSAYVTGSSVRVDGGWLGP